MNGKIAVIVAHPDDEILGAGGVMSKKKDEPYGTVDTFIFSKGRDWELDQRFDTIPHKDIVAPIEDFVKKTQPDIIFTHILNDINLDHVVIGKAVLVACRPTKSRVKALYGFASSLSAFDVFCPDFYVSLQREHVDEKIAVMEKLYKTEMDLPYRKKRGILTQARFWGLKAGCEYAEAFETIFRRI